MDIYHVDLQTYICEHRFIIAISRVQESDSTKARREGRVLLCVQIVVSYLYIGREVDIGCTQVHSTVLYSTIWLDPDSLVLKALFNPEKVSSVFIFCVCLFACWFACWFVGWFVCCVCLYRYST